MVDLIFLILIAIMFYYGFNMFNPRFCANKDNKFLCPDCIYYKVLDKGSFLEQETCIRIGCFKLNNWDLNCKHFCKNKNE